MTRKAATVTNQELRRGLDGLLLQLRSAYDIRRLAKEKHPTVIYLHPKAYDHFLEAMDLVNAKIGIGPPYGNLYTFRGIPLRRGKEGD